MPAIVSDGIGRRKKKISVQEIETCSPGPARRRISSVEKRKSPFRRLKLGGDGIKGKGGISRKKKISVQEIETGGLRGMQPGQGKVEKRKSPFRRLKHYDTPAWELDGTFA